MNSQLTKYAFLAGAAYFCCMATAHFFSIKVPILFVAITVSGLSFVNVSEALDSVLQEGQSTVPYWLQTGAIAFYLVVLITLYIKDGKNS